MAVRSGRSLLVGALLASLALALALAAAPAADAARSAPARPQPCVLSLADQLPPGGTPAYNLKVARLHTTCGTAVQVMKGFHRCRTRTRFTCSRPVLRAWRCKGSTTDGGPTVYGSFACTAPQGRRVNGTYQQARPNCFGAAARDRALPCHNGARTLRDPFPEPYCTCEFGVPAEQATREIVMIGDSHALHWRSAMQVMAAAHGWHGTLFTVGGCFFSAAVGSFAQSCVPWYDSMQAWLRDRPDVDTVFVTSNADTPVDVPPGKTMDEVKIDGFRRAWRAMPPTVKHLVVLRDLTKSTPETLQCVGEASTTAARPLGAVCPLARSTAQSKDVGVVTVERLKDRRYQAIDMSDYVCGPRTCFPVVGGVQVNIDQWGHVNPTFMRTLGPYLLRRVRALEASWKPPRKPNTIRRGSS
jgi:hypothetical protein